MTQLRPVAIATARRSPLLFQSLALSAAPDGAGRRSATFAVSVACHSLLALALALLPVLLGSALPSVSSDFFTPPIVEIRLLPPPPAAPAGGTRLARARREVTPQRNDLVAPTGDVTSLPPADDFLGDMDGDPNGVDGGVPGLRRDGKDVGLVHIPAEPPPPAPPKLVRISRLAAPEPIVRVAPRFPDLAAQIGLGGVVVIEAEVDTTGRVKTARVVSGHKLLDEAALEAVSQWRYRPLLLNGEPTAFILTVNVEFRLRRG
jgi:periplasmic protein TonB